MDRKDVTPQLLADIEAAFQAMRLTGALRPPTTALDPWNTTVTPTPDAGLPAPDASPMIVEDADGNLARALTELIKLDF